VRIGYDGRVHKRYLGPLAKERYENETRVLKYLEGKGCDFAPRILEADPEGLRLVTTNCGSVAPKISKRRADEVFAELERYGVRHEDPFARNITYSDRLGRFCVIDFEFAVIEETGEGLTLEQAEEAAKQAKKARGERLR